MSLSNSRGLRGVARSLEGGGGGGGLEGLVLEKKERARRIQLRGQAAYS